MHEMKFVKDKDTSYFISMRKNRTIVLQDIPIKGYYESIKQNNSVNLNEKILLKNEPDSFKVETYKHGKLIKKEFKHVIQKPNSFPDKYDTIKYYEGQIGGNSAVIIIDNGFKKEHNVNGKIVSETEYLKYKNEYDKHIERRRKVHYYQKYTNDSMLVYEGLFKNVDLICGIFIDYYPDGKLKTIEYYNIMGLREGLWHHYNQYGQLIQLDYYENGEKKE
jgi:hypothetical protein